MPELERLPSLVITFPGTLLPLPIFASSFASSGVIVPNAGCEELSHGLTSATTVLVSLWQNNCVGLRAERFINWAKANANAVKYLTAAAWPAPTGAEVAGGQAGSQAPSRKS